MPMIIYLRLRFSLLLAGFKPGGSFNSPVIGLADVASFEVFLRPFRKPPSNFFDACSLARAAPGDRPVNTLLGCTEACAARRAAAIKSSAPPGVFSCSVAPRPRCCMTISNGLATGASGCVCSGSTAGVVNSAKGLLSTTTASTGCDQSCAGPAVSAKPMGSGVAG